MATKEPVSPERISTYWKERQACEEHTLPHSGPFFGNRSWDQRSANGLVWQEIQENEANVAAAAAAAAAAQNR